MVKIMVSLRHFTSFLFGLTISISLCSLAFSQKIWRRNKYWLQLQVHLHCLEGVLCLYHRKKLILEWTLELKKIGGRKMMKKEMFKKQGINIVNETPKSSEILGATSSNCKLKRSKEQNTDFNPSDTSYNINVGHHRHRRINARKDDSVSLDDADYKAPKSHPPKNN